MMWLAIVLLVAWVLGWAVFKVAGGLIHLLLVIAVVVFVYNLISGRRRV
ncbi:MAG: lmo0937 family membrane protein [Gemmatimonadales bacterium]|nr:lmo0937 family membrane protein [Gemmatimonadales bacterium]